MFLCCTMKELKIFTDGSVYKNNGGWGAVVVYNATTSVLLSGREENTTNNRMELLAAVNALQSVDTNLPLRIHSDATYLVDGVNRYLSGWKADNWTRGGRKLENADLWKEIYYLQMDYKSVKWQWVRSHSGIQHNEMAHKLAHIQSHLET